MKTLAWSRELLIDEIRSSVWRYLGQSSSIESMLLEASALLQMTPESLRAVGGLQFLSCDELGRALRDMPNLARQLSTTTQREEHLDPQRISGSIRWAQTFAHRATTGLEHSYVTAPARRAFQTPENEMLVAVLDATVALGRRTTWHRSTSLGLGILIAERTAIADRWRHARMLVDVTRAPVVGGRLARVRMGRHARTYRHVIAAYDRYRQLVLRLDREAIREAVEHHGLANSDDATLFELVCTFRILEELTKLGWVTPRLEPFQGGLHLTAYRGPETLDVFYQTTPLALSLGSDYRRSQQLHSIQVGGLRPDLVLRRRSRDGDRWLMVEAKGGSRKVTGSARAALLDLLAYRSAFDAALSTNEAPYGLGIAWGTGLTPNSESSILLCTPDELLAALRMSIG